MAAGLLLWDESGNLILDYTTTVARVLGIARTGTTNGSITPLGSNTGELYFMLFSNGLRDLPTFTTTATTISWDWSAVDEVRRADLPFIFGVR